MKRLIDLLEVGRIVNWLPDREAKRGNKDLAWDFDRQEQDGIEYIFLPFQPNGINCCSLGNLDVISNRFSGCIFAAFATGESWFVCHVATSQKLDDDCKENWKRFKSKMVTSVWEFKPSDHIYNGGKAFYRCYGLMTPARDCYAITVIDDGGRHVVSAVEKCKLLRSDKARITAGPASVLAAPLDYPRKVPKSSPT